MTKGIPIEEYPPVQLNPEQASKLKELEKSFAGTLGTDVILVAYKDIR